MSRKYLGRALELLSVVALLALLAILWVGCQPTRGRILLGAKGTTSSTPLSPPSTLPPGEIEHLAPATLTAALLEVDLTQDGERWINILAERRSVAIEGTDVVEIGKSIAVSAGKYDGVRFKMEEEFTGKVIYVEYVDGGMADQTVQKTDSFDGYVGWQTFSTEDGSLLTPIILPDGAEAEITLVFETEGIVKHTALAGEDNDSIEWTKPELSVEIRNESPR
ncbi:MAG: hypothetical protein ACUVXI_08585 [bacterium]